ncbi:MAG: BrnA antitoxin family protein [Candidatus Nitricoxidivorans perseverans]|uniref:BrnA antitoxin family protein n=1 Tax=Candidatus Nitricoxidivorans perseverans TaxID=2975601 RepID=A0AA49IWM4_9PROT|nr:MAG: BrnA antitoxin family protein [Candidatus Nitricoxidivorans perseverans]
MKKIDAHAIASKEYDEIPELTDADMRRARLRVGGKPATREEFSAAVNARLGKQRVSIMLDAAVIEFFKARAGARGYQTLINQALQQVMTGEQIEATLRRVIREELAHG